MHIDKKIGESTLKAFFSNEQLTGGGEITNIVFNANSPTPMAFIYYMNRLDKENVLKKKKFKIDDYEFTVNPYKDKTERSKSLGQNPASEAPQVINNLINDLSTYFVRDFSCLLSDEKQKPKIYEKNK